MPFSLTPEQKQTAFWLSLWLAFLVLLYALSPIMPPFVAAAILAYALNGAVDRLDQWRLGRYTVPRSAAVVLVMTVFLSALLALVLIVIPVLQKEVVLLQAQIPLFLFKLNTMLAPRLHDMGIHVQLDLEGIKKIFTQQLASSGEEIWATVLTSARVGGGAVLGSIVTMTLVPVVLFYMLLDWHRILRNIAVALPRRYVVQTVGMAREVDVLLAQYLRGQLLVMLVLALYYSIALSAAGLEVALPVGIITVGLHSVYRLWRGPGAGPGGCRAAVPGLVWPGRGGGRVWGGPGVGGLFPHAAPGG